MFFKISRNSQEKTCARVPFLIKLQTSDHLQTFEFWKIFKNTCFEEHLWTTGSVWVQLTINLMKGISKSFGREKSNFLDYQEQNQPFRGVLRKRCSENMQQIYRRTPMSKCDFDKAAKRLYWNHNSVLVFPCKFTVYFQNTFP